MWNLLQDIYRIFVYEPELNILNFFFELTGDIGISIILLAIIVNLIIFPLFAKNFINLQKSRILQPKIREIQQKYKDNPQLMLQKIRDFNKEHGVQTGYTFIVLIIQLLFISGLFVLIRDVVEGQEITGLYQIFFDSQVASFTDQNDQSLAFGFINVGARATDYIWIPLLTMFLSYLYGMYTFRWAKKPELGITKKKKKKKPEEQSAFDPEVFQKSMEFQSIYVMPIFLFLVQFNLPIGLNIYFATSSTLSLIRQIVLTNYYQRHTDDLIKRIIDSDPTSKDDDPSNNLEITARPDQFAADQAVVEVVIEDETKLINNHSKTKKKKSKKTEPKTAKEKSIAKKRKKKK